MAAGGSRYRFELTRLEVAGVIVSSAASLFIVFLLGVYAGGGLGARQVADEERVVRLPAAPVENAAPGERELALDDLLGKDPPQAAPARSADVGSPEEKREVAVAGAVPLAVPAESGDRVAGAPAAATNERAPGAAAEAGNGIAPGAAAGGDAEAVATTTSATPGAGAPEARVAVALVPNAAASPPAQRGSWSVQVTATLDPRTADDMLRRLRAKGFDAYVVKAPRQGKTYYRVRVGRFPSAEHAGQMVSRLRREPGVPEAFVASD